VLIVIGVLVLLEVIWVVVLRSSLLSLRFSFCMPVLWVYLVMIWLSMLFVILILLVCRLLCLIWCGYR